jgi:hypothetical protein
MLYCSTLVQAGHTLHQFTSSYQKYLISSYHHCKLVLCAVTGLTGDSCHQCPVGTYSTGTIRDACLSCPFGTTSAVGSNSRADCVPSATACPPGMSAPPGAASAAQCVCLTGWGTTGGSSELLFVQMGSGAAYRCKRRQATKPSLNPASAA